MCPQGKEAEIWVRFYIPCSILSSLYAILSRMLSVSFRSDKLNIYCVVRKTWSLCAYTFIVWMLSDLLAEIFKSYWIWLRYFESSKSSVVNIRLLCGHADWYHFATRCSDHIWTVGVNYFYQSCKRHLFEENKLLKISFLSLSLSQTVNCSFCQEAEEPTLSSSSVLDPFTPGGERVETDDGTAEPRLLVRWVGRPYKT